MDRRRRVVDMLCGHSPCDPGAWSLRAVFLNAHAESNWRDGMTPSRTHPARARSHNKNSEHGVSWRAGIDWAPVGLVQAASCEATLGESQHPV